jgi:hypothetical protein
MNRDWWAPLTGVAFVVLLILSFIVAGEPPDANEDVQKIVAHYKDNKDAIFAGALLSMAAAVLLVFFANTLRKTLHREEGAGGGTSPIVLAGATIIATGAAIDGTISIALAEAVEDIDPAATQALQALWDNDFLPLALGLSLFFLGAGISIVRHGGLPKWLGWIAILLGIAAITPVGFAAFLGGAVWVLVASVMMTLRNRAGQTPHEPAPAG